MEARYLKQGRFQEERTGLEEPLPAMPLSGLWLEHPSSNFTKRIFCKKFLNKREEDMVFLMDMIDEALHDGLGHCFKLSGIFLAIRIYFQLGHGASKPDEFLFQKLMILAHQERGAFNVSFQHRKQRFLFPLIVDADFILNEPQRGHNPSVRVGGEAVLHNGGRRPIQ